MKDRIRQIMEDQKLNQQSFAQLIGKSTATLSNIFNDRTKPTLDIVDAITIEEADQFASTTDMIIAAING